MSVGSLEGDDLSQAGFVHVSFLLALPEEIFVLFGEGTQVHVVIGVAVLNRVGVKLHGFAVGFESGPDGRPVGVEDFLMGHVGAQSYFTYANTQSSY